MGWPLAEPRAEAAAGTWCASARASARAEGAGPWGWARVSSRDAPTIVTTATRPSWRGAAIWKDPVPLSPLAGGGVASRVPCGLIVKNDFQKKKRLAEAT